MASTLAGDVPVRDAPPARPDRPRVLLVGTALGLGGAAMLFAGLVGLYLSNRHDALVHHRTWLPKGSIPLTGPNIALFTLLLSIGTVHWALSAIRNDDRQNTWVALGLTLLLGAAFINASSFIWVNLHLGVAKSKAALLLFTITGAHVAMVAAGMVFVLLAAFRTLGGQYGGRDREGVAALVLYWDVTVAIFVVLWYAIYITK